VKRALLIGGLAVATLFSLAASAQAALVFSRFAKVQTIWIANDNGTNAHKLADNGQTPSITSDGQTVFFQRPGRTRTDLMRVPAAGGTPVTVVRGLQYGVQVVSPNGAWVAVTTGPLNGAQKLTLLDVATGATRTVATGYFFGASFSPDSSQLAYSRAARQDFKATNDVYLAPTATAGTPTNLTNDGHSAYPVWGPTQIAFSRWKLHYGPKHAESGPAYNITVINADGTGRRNVTNDKVPYLLSGLTATAWSADGQRLLAQFSGQDNTHAVGIEVGTGQEHVIGPNTEFGAVGYQLSSDGQTVLGAFGPPEAIGNVVTIPWASANPHIIVRKAGEPSWSAP
jgi:Tol biopolymer transport system component